MIEWIVGGLALSVIANIFGEKNAPVERKKPALQPLKEGKASLPSDLPPVVHVNRGLEPERVVPEPHSKLVAGQETVGVRSIPPTRPVGNPITIRNKIQTADLWRVLDSGHIEELGREKSGPPRFRLFHMTHFDNVKSIVRNGLLSHRLAHETDARVRDISNRSVNDRRGVKTCPNGRSLHEFVPLYFNPRNAMLYEKQKEHCGRIAIIELSHDICRRERVLYSEGNAAASVARLTFDPREAEKFQWEKINAPSWRENKDRNLTLMRLMMSECLVPERVSASYIVSIHVKDNAARSDLFSSCQAFNGVPVSIAPDLFF